MMDSMGRTMGFNDRLSPEHYLIMVRNFDAADLLSYRHAYEWLLAAAHLIGAGLLLAGACISTRATRWFFAAQAIAFPFGILGVFILPPIVFGVLTGNTDREWFVDIPFIKIVAHPVWVLTSMYIMFALRGESLGLGRIWNGLVRIWRAGMRTFVNAVR